MLGVTDSFPGGKRRTGRPAKGGQIVTGGGVTFVGGADDQRFRAFDIKTGKELWTYKLDYSPMPSSRRADPISLIPTAAIA